MGGPMRDSIFFDNKSEERDNDMQQESSLEHKPILPPPDLNQQDLNLTNSKFKPIISHLHKMTPASDQLLNILDNPLTQNGVPLPPNGAPQGLCFPGPMGPPPPHLMLTSPPLPMMAPPSSAGSSPSKNLPLFCPLLPPGPFPPPPGMPLLNPNFPLPPPFFNHQLFPFPPFGRDMKKIGKRWGRSKRAKGKVDIDKSTGRKLITAITCVACFKAKKKCIYADQNAKRCNYCLNRGINCVKRIDRRCQKIWHESGRRARLVSIKERKRSGEELKSEEPVRLGSSNDMDTDTENDLLLNLPNPDPLLRGRLPNPDPLFRGPPILPEIKREIGDGFCKNLLRVEPLGSEFLCESS